MHEMCITFQRGFECSPNVYLILCTAVLSSTQLWDLSHEICSMWKNVGIRLGLPKFTLDNIAGTPSLDTPQQKAFEMLIKWLQLQTSPSHVAQLISALELEGRKDLAQKCCTYVQVRDMIEWLQARTCVIWKDVPVLFFPKSRKKTLDKQAWSSLPIPPPPTHTHTQLLLSSWKMLNLDTRDMSNHVLHGKESSGGGKREL